MSTPFRQLEPPPGGLPRLRAALIERQERLARRRRALLLGAALCCCVIASVWLVTWRGASPRAASTARWAPLHPAISLAQRAPLDEAAHASHTSRTGVARASRAEGVSYYRVSVLDD